jgi:antitoxin HicB
MAVHYPARFIFNQIDQRYTVTFFDLPEAITEGETLEEAYTNAAEVLALTLEGRSVERIEIPSPSRI